MRPSSGAFVADEPAGAPRTAAADRLELAALRDQVRRAKATLNDVERAIGEMLDRRRRLVRTRVRSARLGAMN